jgi:DNA-directed RNA polymerase subunit RPC12/RpoP
VPRYSYECAECKDIIAVFHGINEVIVDCKKCNGTPIIAKKQKSDNNKVGELTKEYIEENRKILELQKKELKEKDYEST